MRAGRIALAALLAFGSATAHMPRESALSSVPEKARARRNPFDDDPEASTAGKKIFEQHCAECHGESADGSRRGPGLRSSEVRDAPPGSLFWLLTNGAVRQGMPSWSKLPEAQRWQIIVFLKSSISAQ